MKFSIRRTSNGYSDETEPCDGVVQEIHPRFDARTLKSFEDFEKKFGYSFLDKGVNHQVIRGPRGGAHGIVREFPGERKLWVREFNTLEELIAFADEEGALVLGYADDIYELEIYDDYRE